MNNKAFALIELLAVVAILGLITTIAIPKVIDNTDNSKKEFFIIDAKDFVEKAMYRQNFKKYESLFTTDSNCSIITLRNLGINNKKNPDGDYYDIDNSKVYSCIVDSEYKYYVYLIPLNKDGRGIKDLIEINELTVSNIK